MSRPESQYESLEWAAELLITKLQSRNTWFADVAESELVSLGHDAIPALRNALESGDWCSWRVARVLSRLQHPDVVPLLVQAYRRADPGNAHVRSFFGGQIAVDARQGHSDTLRLLIVEALSDRQAPETVPFLCEALRDPWWNVRCAAATGLAQQATSGPAAGLRTALPRLRELTGGRRLGAGDAEQRAYRKALECIETATAATGRLPIPAAPARVDPRDLPLPAASQETGAP